MLVVGGLGDGDGTGGAMSGIRAMAAEAPGTGRTIASSGTPQKLRAAAIRRSSAARSGRAVQASAGISPMR